MTNKVQKIRSYLADMANADGAITVVAKAINKEILPYIDSLQKETISGLDNGDMPIERWKQAVKAASNQRSYRSSKGLTETKDDYFVDGVQWADEHPKKEPVSDDLEKAARKYAGIPEDSPHDLKYCVQDKKAKYDAVLYGANLQKQQMMAKAVDGDITFDYYGDNDKTYGCIAHDSFCLEDFGLKDKDKVKVIVIKED